ncbi:MAG: hypothetical protein QW815_08285 [Nitrososphaerota archaeon]
MDWITLMQNSSKIVPSKVYLFWHEYYKSRGESVPDLTVKSSSVDGHVLIPVKEWFRLCLPVACWGEEGEYWDIVSYFPEAIELFAGRNVDEDMVYRVFARRSSMEDWGMLPFVKRLRGAGVRLGHRTAAWSGSVDGKPWVYAIYIQDKDPDVVAARAIFHNARILWWYGFRRVADKVEVGGLYWDGIYVRPPKRGLEPALTRSEWMGELLATTDELSPSARQGSLL